MHGLNTAPKLDAAPRQETPPPISRVLHDSSFYLLGNIVSRLIGFLFIPFYARFLSPAQYGLVELVELSTQTIAIALGLQAIGAALSRLFHDQRTPQQEQAVVSTSLIATAVLSGTVTVVAVITAGPLCALVFHSQEWTGLLRAAFIAMFFGEMAEVVLVYERIKANARFFLAYSLVSLALNLSLNILFIGALGAGVWGFVSSKLVVSIGGSLFLLFRVRRTVGWHWRSLYVPELVRFGSPLILSSLSYFAIHFSDRFFLSSAVSLAELGRYALAYKFAMLVSALVGDSFAKSWGTTLYRYTGQPGWQARFARVASFFTYLLFATGFAIAMFSPEMLRIMVPPDFYPPPLLLPLLIGSYVAREIGDFFRSLLLINKRSVRVSQIAFSGALVNGAANVLLIPAFGIYGAAAATLITWAVYMIACWVIANREHRLPVRKTAFVTIALLAIVLYTFSQLTRVSPLVPQLLLDGLWAAAFCAAALALFFSPEERHDGLALAGSGVLWLLDRGWPIRSAAGADGRRAVVLLADRAFGPERSKAMADDLRRGSDAPAVTLSVRQDGRFAWLGSVCRAAVGQGVAGKADPEELGPGTVLVSASPLAGTRLIAFILKHRHALPWIACLPDAGQGRKGFNGFLERLTLEHADAVVAPVVDAATVCARHPAFAAKIYPRADPLTTPGAPVEADDLAPIIALLSAHLSSPSASAMATRHP